MPNKIAALTSNDTVAPASLELIDIPNNAAITVPITTP
jgi:hypothetical protein